MEGAEEIGMSLKIGLQYLLSFENTLATKKRLRLESSGTLIEKVTCWMCTVWTLNDFSDTQIFCETKNSWRATRFFYDRLFFHGKKGF